MVSTTLHAKAAVPLPPEELRIADPSAEEAERLIAEATIPLEELAECRNWLPSPEDAAEYFRKFPVLGVEHWVRQP